MPLPLKPFYMIRHGETEANAARLMAGSIDSPLTKLGRDQAFEAQKVIATLEIKPVAIFHSHLSRARDTAHIINEALNVEIFEDKDLAEIHAGDLEGASYDHCRELFEHWPRVLNGEDPNEFFKRVRQGKSRAIEKFNEPVLIVCHGGVMRALGAIYKYSIPGKFENAHLYEFQPNPEKNLFPWDVFDYRFCEIKNTPVRNISDVYDVSSAEKIAS